MSELEQRDPKALQLDWTPEQMQRAGLRSEMAMKNLLKYDREGGSIRKIVWWEQDGEELFKFTVTWAKKIGEEKNE